MKPTQFVKTSVLVLIFILAGCNESHENNEEKLPLYGKPTKVLSNESLVDALCKIQSEFRDLPKPLMLNMSQKGEWTTKKIGAPTAHYRGFSRIHLRPEALTFLQQHSRLELVASLVPLFIDPEVGGEAAVLLAGIPAGSDSMQGGTTGNLSSRIKETDYKSRENQGTWNDNGYNQFSAVTGLYGLTNSTSRIHKKNVVELPGSLESSIIELLRDLENAPLKFLEIGYLHMPQPHTIETVRKWIDGHRLPLPSTKTKKFVEQYKGDFATMVMLPKIGQPQGLLNLNEYYMMWLTGRENEYWPALLNLNSGQKYRNQLIKDFRKYYVKKAYDICQEGRANS